MKHSQYDFDGLLREPPPLRVCGQQDPDLRQIRLELLVVGLPGEGGPVQPRYEGPQRVHHVSHRGHGGGGHGLLVLKEIRRNSMTG